MCKFLSGLFGGDDPNVSAAQPIAQTERKAEAVVKNVSVGSDTDTGSLGAIATERKRKTVPGLSI